MADGHIPSTGFNQQLVRLVNKDQRRPQNSIETQTKWQNRAGTTGGGGSQCVCRVDHVFNYVLQSGSVPVSTSQKRAWSDGCTGTRLRPYRFYFAGTASDSAPGGSFDQLLYERNRNAGYVEWTPVDNEELTITGLEQTRNITSEVKVYDATGTDVTSTSSVSAAIYERYFTSPPTLVIYITCTDPNTSTTFYAWLSYVPETIYSGQYDIRFIGGQTGGFIWALDYISVVPGLYGAHDALIGSYKICSKPVGVSTSGTTAPLEFTQADTIMYFTQAITAGGDAWEWNNTITAKVINNTSEDITITYDPDNFFVNWGQQKDLNASNTFTALSLATTNYVIATSTFYSEGLADQTSDVIGSVTGTGDTSGDAYSASGSHSEAIE